MKLLEPFSFELPTEIVYGPGVVQNLPEVLSKHGGKRALLVSDRGIEQAGILGRVADILSRTGFPFSVFTGVEANPKDVNVQAGAEMAVESGADCLIALGGGSPIDCAKGIGVVISHGGAIRDYEGRDAVRAGIPPLVAIPTTSGTGSEVTFSAVITDTNERFKFSIRHPGIAARTALADPDLTISMPPLLTASTGMDALTHAIEGYSAMVSEPIADACALHAVELIAANIRTAVMNGNDRNARAGMLLGSMLAGIAFSHSDVASVHCIAEALGGMYDAPHGVCNAVVLPHMMEFNMPWCENRYERIGAAMGLAPGGGASATVEAVRKMARDVGLPPFASLGVSEKDLGEIALKSTKNGSNASNPRPMGETEYMEVLRKMYGGQ